MVTECHSRVVRRGTLFVILAVATLLALFIALVVVPGVQRGGWLELVGVGAVIAAIAVLERWFRRVSRRR